MTAERFKKIETMSQMGEALTRALDLYRKGEVRRIVLKRMDKSRVSESEIINHRLDRMANTGKIHLFLMDFLGQDQYLSLMQAKVIVIEEPGPSDQTSEPLRGVLFENAEFRLLVEKIEKIEKVEKNEKIEKIEEIEEIDKDDKIGMVKPVHPVVQVSASEPEQNFIEAIAGHVDFSEVSEVSIQFKSQNKVMTLNFKAGDSGFEKVESLKLEEVGSQPLTTVLKLEPKADPLVELEETLIPTETLENLPLVAVDSQPAKGIVLNRGYWGTALENKLAVLTDETESGMATSTEADHHQMIVFETVKSDFWGAYKVRAIQDILKSQIANVNDKESQEPLTEEEADHQAALFVDQKKKYLVGKIAGSDLLDQYQKWIIRKGESITSETVDAAIEADVLVELIINMTLPGLDGSYE